MRGYFAIGIAHPNELMKHLLLVIAIVALASPVVAAEPEIRFTFPEWQSILHQEGLRQEEIKLLRQQNADLKQLVTLTTEQKTQCEQINKSYEELSVVADELQRAMDRENAELKESVRWRNWVIGGQAAVIAGLIVWIVW